MKPMLQKKKLLQLVPYEHSGLRKKTAPVNFPLSTEDQQIIADMLYSIHPQQLLAVEAWVSQAAGMAANQWGIDKSIFLFCPQGNDSGNIEVIINPSYTVLSDKQDEGWEGCFSIPNATGNVKRYLHIKARYQDQTGTWIEKKLRDWPARVWQHENDHLNGLLFDDQKAGKCLEKQVFNNEQELNDFYDRLRTERRST